MASPADPVPARFHQNLQLDQQLCFAPYTATHAMTRSYKQALASVGLTYPQYLVMLVLWEHDGASMSEVAAALDLDKPSVTPLVQRLVAAGWLRRTRLAGDERVAALRVEPKGWRLQAQVADIQRTVACRTQLERGEFDELKSSLLSLAARLNEALDTVS